MSDSDSTYSNVQATQNALSSIGTFGGSYSSAPSFQYWPAPDTDAATRITRLEARLAQTEHRLAALEATLNARVPRERRQGQQVQRRRKGDTAGEAGH